MMDEVYRGVAKSSMSYLFDLVEHDIKSRYPETSDIDMELAKMFALGYADGVTDEWNRTKTNDYDFSDVTIVYKTGLERFLDKVLKKKEERK